MSKIIIVDIEADGPIPGIHSMVCFGAVLLDKHGNFDKTFYGQTKPITEVFVPEALAVSGFSRKQHLSFEDPFKTMLMFKTWLDNLSGGKPILYSDNNQFDGAYINYYFNKYLGANPFGFSSHRIGNIFQGWFNDPYYKWKQHRATKHTHNPVDDAKGNAEALHWLYKQGYKLF